MKQRNIVNRLPYREGTWFAIPLRPNGFAIGCVARYSGDGCVLGYFYGPARANVPTFEDTSGLMPEAAVRVARVSDLALLRGRWKILGERDDWNRDAWPIPKFLRRDELGKRAWLVTYSDSNPLDVVAEVSVPFEVDVAHRDGLEGSGAAEVLLSKCLA